MAGGGRGAAASMGRRPCCARVTPGATSEGTETEALLTDRPSTGRPACAKATRSSLPVSLAKGPGTTRVVSPPCSSKTQQPPALLSVGLLESKSTADHQRQRETSRAPERKGSVPAEQPASARRENKSTRFKGLMESSRQPRVLSPVYHLSRTKQRLCQNTGPLSPGQLCCRGKDHRRTHH